MRRPGCLLDLGQGLEQADGDTDDQADDQARRAELKRQPDRVPADIKNLGARHAKPRRNRPYWPLGFEAGRWGGYG